ncbi:MAG: hypothetical protein Dasosvirus18_2, partial [Dasosvirus sp.]
MAKYNKGSSRVIEDTYKVLSDGFIRYCLSVLPRKVIKSVCKISEGEQDPDIVVSVQEILIKSLDRLEVGSGENDL